MFKKNILFILVTILVAVNAPFFNRSVWFDSDGVSLFQRFYSFYTHFFFHGTIAQWNPYESFGIPAGILHAAQLKPSHYAAGLIGWLLRIKDVAWLFKFAHLIDLLLFLFGLFLLSSTFFRHKTSIFFVCLGASVSVFWLPQVVWRLHILYLIPLILYFLTRFFNERKPYLFFLAGLASIFSCVGNPIYFAALYLLIWIVFSIFYAKRFFLSFRWVKPSGRDVVFGLIMVVVGFAYLSQGLQAFDHVEIIGKNRDPTTLGVSLDTYLHDGDQIGIHRYLGLFFAQGPQAGTATYVGILALIFILYRLVRPKHSIHFIAIGTVTLLLILMSLGDQTFVATAVYYLFPPIRWFHYLGDLGETIRIFLYLCAGFGLDQFMSDVCDKNRNTFPRNPRVLFLSCATVVLGVMALLMVWNSGGRLYTVAWPKFVTLGFVVAMVTSVFLGLPRMPAKSLAVIFILGAAIDIFSYRYLLFSSWPHKFPWITKEGVSARPYQYQEQRTLPWERDAETADANRVAAARPNGFGRNSFLMTDSCFQPHGSFWVEGTHQFADPSFHTPSILKSLGCLAQKTRLISGVVVAHNADHAKFLFLMLTDLDRLLVFYDSPDAYQFASEGSVTFESLGDVSVRFFSFDELVVDAVVKRPGGAWLFYPDAYHPDWKAYVNGEQVPIERANLAFKAVRLKEGEQEVRFVFYNPWNRIINYSAALFGVLFIVSILLALVLHAARFRQIEEHAD